jgi:alanyl-tRNA synthetase
MEHLRVRKIFNDFFRDKGHHPVLSAPLVPAKDPTLLFTNAGMNQFKEVFIGKEKRNYSKAVSIQKCMRVSGKHNDFNEVGKTEFHHTFFEMLGNFSFGDYFKEKAIEYSWDLLINHYHFNPDELWITVYKTDDEAFDIWKNKIGIAPDKIIRLGDKENFWQMGEVGPCGPCSEIHFDKGNDFGIADIENNEDRFVEIWNLVFMQYLKDKEGKLNPLPSPSIDTGMGLERLTALLQEKDSNYKTDLFKPIIDFTRNISENDSNDKDTEISLKVITDHTRALTFLISDGVIPSNDGRGYVLRRLLRRAARHGKRLGFEEPFIHRVSGKVIEVMDRAYPELITGKNFIKEIILSEEKRFSRTLLTGLKRFEDLLTAAVDRNENTISGKEIFKLSDTYGFPFDFAIDLANEKNIGIDTEEYQRELEIQKDRSRKNTIKNRGKSEHFEGTDSLKTIFRGYERDELETEITALYEKTKSGYVRRDFTTFENSESEYIAVFKETPFYAESGGQVGDRGTGENKNANLSIFDTRKTDSGVFLHSFKLERGTLKVGDRVNVKIDKDYRKSLAIHHTSTHLLHSALKDILGEHIKQSGSLVESEKFRFDFAHYKAVSNEELIEVENLVNYKIRENLQIYTEEMPYENAIKKGAIAIFNEKYSDIVRLVNIGNFSKELCGGTHLRYTGEIGLFKIISESSISSGVRRIEACSGKTALSFVQRKQQILNALQNQFGQRDENLLEYFKKLNENLKIKTKNKTTNSTKIDFQNLLKDVKEKNGVKFAVKFLENTDRKTLSSIADKVSEKINGVSILFSNLNGKSTAIISVNDCVIDKYDANEIIKGIAPVFNGKGGGKKSFAQAGGELIDNFNILKEKIYKYLDENE